MRSVDAPLRLSVIVPVYRDWPALERCLAALAAQTLPMQDFEVLVVSNEETPPPAYLARGNVRLLHEPAGHSYAARNAGLVTAQGAVLAFTDSDCRPEPDWLTQGLAALQRPGVSLVGGRVLMVAERQSLAADYDCCFAFPQAENIRQGHSVTANLFVKRAVFESVGTFNAALQSSGDFDFCRRAVTAGFQLHYAENAVVKHPARDRLEALFRKNRRVAGGTRRRQLDLQGKGLGARLAFVRPLIKPPLRHWWRLLRGHGKTAGLPPLRRIGVVGLLCLLHYHFAVSVLRTPPSKEQH